jgi:hypothetical protein
MNNNLEFENTDPSPDSVEDNYPRTNYGEGYYEEPNPFELPDDVFYQSLEEPKQETNKTHYLDELPNTDKDALLKMWNAAMPKLEPKQETPEQAAEKYAIIDDKHEKYKCVQDFIAGAKWQAKRMYSEEDMRKAFIAGGNSQIEEDDDYGSAYDAYMEEWFKQFKKKKHETTNHTNTIT